MTYPEDILRLFEPLARAFGDLLDEVVFVGGAVTPLLVTDHAVADFRPTDDVDVIIEVTSHRDYHALEEELRRLDFQHDTSEGAPICRWIVEGTKVDVMPSDPAILGFSNRWYPYALATAVPLRLAQGLTMRYASAIAFLATKMEAFQSPSRPFSGDYRASHDLEDILSVIDGRPSLPDEAEQADSDVSWFITTTVRTWLSDEDFLDAVPGHLEQGTTNPARTQIVLARLNRLAALSS